MLKKFTATAAAAAIVLSSISATPAQALSREESIGLLFGIAAVGILANEASKDKKDKKKRHSSRSTVPVIKVDPSRGYQATRNTRGLPAKCQTTVPTRNGDKTFFGAPCLKRAGFNAPLPQRCERRLDLGRRMITAYARRCLLNEGYRVRG